jgi:uncharacterized protein YndB with AHSA1/START domain
MATETQALDVRSPIALDIEAEIWIDAAPEHVWKALVDDIGAWWHKAYRDERFGVFLEPHIGGRFYEQFDESGAGALYGLVTFFEPCKTLRLTGSFGLPGARHYVKTYQLEARDGGTAVRTTASWLGDIDEETLQGYRQGGADLLEALKRHAESRRA